MAQERCSLSFICLMVFVGSITAFGKSEKDSPQLGYYYDTPENDFELPGSNGKTLEEKQEQRDETVIRENEKTSKGEHERHEGIRHGEHHGPGEHQGHEEQHGQGEHHEHGVRERPGVHDGHGEYEGIRHEVHEETEQ